jgi:hypothetical protein
MRPVIAGLTAIVALLVASVAVASANSHHSDSSHGWHDHPSHHESKAEHVLLLSVDGLHQSDLQWYVGKHPHSALASLVGNGVEFTHAETPVPSDSVPGMVGQVTGGNPGTTGMYYDETYNRELLPAGTTNCAEAKPGAEVLYTEQADENLHSIDAGQGLSGRSTRTNTSASTRSSKSRRKTGCAPHGWTNTRPTTSSRVLPVKASTTYSPPRSTAMRRPKGPQTTGPPTTP